MGQDSAWEYDGKLVKHLEAEPWKNEWRERALVDWMEGLCEYVDLDAWKEVLRRGEDFLRRAPRSRLAPQVMLHLAEAHETAWSVAFTIDPHVVDYGEYREKASAHRQQAITLYERYLTLNPNALDRDVLRLRIQRLRQNIDTGFQRYYCFSDC